MAAKRRMLLYESIDHQLIKKCASLHVNRIFFSAYTCTHFGDPPFRHRPLHLFYFITTHFRCLFFCCCSFSRSFSCLQHKNCDFLRCLCIKPHRNTIIRIYTMRNVVHHPLCSNPHNQPYTLFARCRQHWPMHDVYKQGMCTQLQMV